MLLRSNSRDMLSIGMLVVNPANRLACVVSALKQIQWLGYFCPPNFIPHHIH